MHSIACRRMGPFVAGLFTASCLWGAEGFVARTTIEGKDPGLARLRVKAEQRSPHAIPRFLTGKFAEHLGWNIYNGMDAQVLRNPTFADYPFSTGQMSPDGVAKFHADDARIESELRRLATRFGWPETELNALVEARHDSLACLWTRVGPRDAVQVSPDTGPFGGRAQRIEVKAAGQGIAQWTWLPLHRERRLEFEIMARSPDLQSLRVGLARPGAKAAFCDVKAIPGLSREWRKFAGTLEVKAGDPADASYRLSITAEAPGQFVLRHVFLRPADHVDGADPDVIRRLKESKLPLLRWPGGNFVSGYHWEDGVGPLEQRPTRPNDAWGGVEPNTFGTDEFIAFCRAVGCEPMICLNAGNGTAAEAARWVEYCNGPATSPLGRLRAANGHPEPFNVRHWEVGNELWGRWQFNWTTASGYVDRYQGFVPALLKADPTLELYACGAPVFWGKAWNDTLIAGAGPLLRNTTDHPLIGGDVPLSTDPLDVYRDFMGVPEVLEKKWAALRADMERAGIREPRLAVTELQLFAHLGPRPDAGAPVRLTQKNLPSQGSITEAIYDVLIYHAAVRLAPFVSMVTHSAVVNHGGGLRKERERVYANPCHYAQAAFAAFADASPVAVEIDSAPETAPRVLPDLWNAAPELSFSGVDALAALAPDGSLLISIVHRGSAGPVRLAIEWSGYRAAETAEVRRLSGEHPWSGNTLEQMDAVRPVDETVAVKAGQIELEFKPYTVALVRVPSAKPQ